MRWADAHSDPLGLLFVIRQTQDSRRSISFHASSPFHTSQDACFPNHIAPNNAFRMTQIINIRDRIAVYFLAENIYDCHFGG